VDLVSQVVADVIAAPEQYAVNPVGCRHARVPRFPYVVLFEVADDELLMFGVLHTARSMEKWRERQKDA
jgi:hypothetical protein